MRLDIKAYVYILFFTTLFIVPVLTNSHLILNILIMVFFYAYLSLAWNILAGFAGQYSLGHAAYLGIGAYTTALLYVRTGMIPWLGLLVGAALAALFALGISYPTFRFGIKGYYYILTTLAVAEILRRIFLYWDLTGRADGVRYPLKPDSFLLFQFHMDRTPYYYIMLVFLILILFISYIIRNSQFGLHLLAIRDDEDAAQSIRINTLKCKLIAAAISAALTAVAGAFYAQYTLFIEPDTTMSLFISIDILLPSLMGGTGTIAGPLIGSFLLTPLAWIFRIAYGAEVLHMIIRGVALMIIVALIPKGIAGTVIDYYIRPRHIKR